MKIYLEPQVEAYDDRMGHYQPPIRTEVIEYVMEALAPVIQALSNYINPKTLNMREVIALSEKITSILSPLNMTENAFLDWYSANYISNKNEPKRTRTPYWQQDFSNYGINRLGAIIDQGNLEDITSAVERFQRCFDLEVLNYQLSNFCAHEDFTIDPVRTSMETIYNYELKNYIDNIVRDYVAIRNVEITFTNRTTLKDYRTCSKCGTIFQREKSRNMHFPKCNGVNKGYYTGRVGSGTEKTSEW